ncbi:hypothetical protein CAI21_19245 [Alkalilimnicola ehrlichii]|uniref:Bile acid:sodium symporter n=1 Tax=Alkalilimnicola ehrlichii TaxID=351052 RepID=A0A3E0WIE3_9GAMM|nr:bile acid:sodium symporter family protein [Alkalilimnicola ehrlichii]RFA25372.1 hypothetical protein CAI21_19245 [Alkalilimnicola ehrlichii]RFA32548.1 hypothetical protein CAL65_19510 [Alkalilimnicola ehrlichii]
MGDPVNILLDIILPLTLILIMFGMGMTLTPKDFIRLKEYPRAIFAGLGGQLLLLPIVGAALAVLWNLSPELAVGLIILAACPGGTTSNLISHLAHGDRPLSITLTAVNSCIVVFTIPLFAALAIGYFADGGTAGVPVPVAEVMGGVFIFTIVPVGLGMIVRSIAPRFSTRIGPLYDRFAALSFLLIVLIILWTTRQDLFAMLPAVGSVTIALSLIMTGLGLFLGFILALKLRQALTIGIEVGIQNTVLGMAVAGLLTGVGGLNGMVMMIPSALYGLIMFAPAIALIAFGRRRLSSPLAEPKTSEHPSRTPQQQPSS